MKKLISFALALLMVFSVSVTVFAAGETGSITIENIVVGDAHYSLYRILDLQSYDLELDGGTYAYVLNAKWAEFFVAGDGKDYVTIENISAYVPEDPTQDFSQFYVTWKEGVSTDRYTKVQEFAKAALAYAQEKGISPDKDHGDIVISDSTGTFNNLPLGYYLVDSNVGALCSLTTTNPNAKITAKNGVPTLDKQVKEDSTGHYGESNTAGFDEVMEFMTTIYVQGGAQNYVLHDKMHNMTFAGVTKITRNTAEVLVEGTDYTVTNTCTDSTCACTFQVVFASSFTDTLKSGDTIVVEYKAILTEAAVVGEEGNANETHLVFGENMSSMTDSTKTYTYGFELVKTDAQNLLLDGATFKIYTAATDGTEVALFGMDTDSDGVVDLYRHNHSSSSGHEVVVKDGVIRIEGIDSGTYYLEEITAPEGFNKLTERQAFTITKNEYASISVKAGTTRLEVTTGTGVQVVNKGGTILPETGGKGTVMFVTFGTLVVLCTGVLLVTKKRMSMIQE